MLTRAVEITAKTGKSHELANTIHEKVLSILKKQSGFVDETLLTSDMESNRVLALSFWKTKDDAERYHREQYPKITEMFSPLLETAPVIRTFKRAYVDAAQDRRRQSCVGREQTLTPSVGWS